MDRNLNDVYQEEAVACSNAALLENGCVTAEQLEPDILLSIKKEDLVCPCNLHVSFWLEIITNLMYNFYLFNNNITS
jgi:hypothetical protein